MASSSNNSNSSRAQGRSKSSNSIDMDGEVPTYPSRKPPLHRNNACLPCKRRKRKCDAIKPVCGPCGNSARLYQEAPQCEWASTTTTTNTTKASSPVAAAAAAATVKRELVDAQADNSSGSHIHSNAAESFPKASQRRPLSSSISRILDSPTDLPLLPGSIIDSSRTTTSIQYTNHPGNDSSTTALFSHQPPPPPSSPIRLGQRDKDGIIVTTEKEEKDSFEGHVVVPATTTITNTNTARRKNLKRDNESAQVESLQARIAELENQLKSALLSHHHRDDARARVGGEGERGGALLTTAGQPDSPAHTQALPHRSHDDNRISTHHQPPLLNMHMHMNQGPPPLGRIIHETIGADPTLVTSSASGAPPPPPPSLPLYNNQNHSQVAAAAAHIALPPSPISSASASHHYRANTTAATTTPTTTTAYRQSPQSYPAQDGDGSLLQMFPPSHRVDNDYDYEKERAGQLSSLYTEYAHTQPSSSMYAIPPQQYAVQQQQQGQQQLYQREHAQGHAQELHPTPLPQQMQFLQGGKIVPSGAWNITPTSSNSNSPSGGHLLWTQWPADLPHLDIVKALAGTALAMLSDTLFLLPADSVFRSLALPPTDPRFPSIALLHALCAIGATACPLPPEARGYWQSQDAPSPSTYHFRQAKKHLQTFNVAQILDDTRAGILLTVYSFAAEQFIDVWQLVGLVCRSMAPTGLNHIQNNNALPSTKMSITPGHFLRKPTFLPPPADDYDVFYRSTTLYWAFSCDVWMGACSGWAMALDIQDVSTLLPVWPSDTTPLDIVLNQPSLDPHSPIFFSSHLDSPVLSLHLSIKAMVLFRRVVDFLQRSTSPDCVITAEAKHQIRATPAFQALTETLLTFQQHFPTKVKYPLQTLPSGKLDANLLNAHFVPCTALLLLYEPFILGTDEDEGFHRISMTAANQILQMTDLIYAHSKDSVSMYYTQINYSWMVCNRTLIRAMRFREDVNDFERAKGLRASVEFLLARNATLASRSPLVGSCLGMIENLVKDESPWHRM